MTIDHTDIEDLANRDDFMGFGYLGHSHRNHATDAALARVANGTGLKLADVFLWANSRPARHFMDCAPDARTEPTAFEREAAITIIRELPGLRAEVNA